MNILHINSSDIVGGAAIAGNRLHQGLLAQGITSRLLVGVVKDQQNGVAGMPRRFLLEDYLARLTSPLGLNYVNIISSFEIPKHPFFREADILTFHNLHCNYFNYLAIPTLTTRKPAVYRMPDMWAFTGHCTYSYECERWKIGCGRCPYPKTFPPIKRDATRLEWKLKHRVYQHARLTIVTPSRWLANLASESMLKHCSIHHIPNGIDIGAYQPLDVEFCRAVLGIPKHKNVVMFCAENLIDPRKGIDLLITALAALPKSLKTNIILLTLGGSGGEVADHVGIPTISLGYVDHDRLKALAFSAADLFIFPTRADNFPLALQESLACGTPIVSFAVGGVPELVRPGMTGYLAQAENACDFCDGIVHLLEDQGFRETMRAHCRRIAIEEYALELQVQRYIALYHEILALPDAIQNHEQRPMNHVDL